jgi:CDP-4-dehydro-6-deoxyglucose reductase
MAAPTWQKGIVTKIENETYNTKRFWIQLPDAPSFDFKPGQFVTIDMPIHEKPNKRWRSYSIASWPDGNVIELLIVLLEGGAGTTWLFNNVHVGSELTLRGPQGVFTLPDPIEKDLFFICTGTGIAPFRSMLHYMKQHNLPHKNVYLIFGTRTQKDLVYYEELKALEKDIDGFQFLPTLSREQWEGCCGYVHAVYEKLCAQKQPAQFYLCGWKAMIDEARKRIADLGYDRKAIHLELYG